MNLSLPLMICGIILLNGCSHIEVPTTPSYPVTPCQIGRDCTTPTNPNNPNNPILNRSTIELRVLGNATSVRVRYSNSQDGLTQVITTLPYIVTFETSSDTMFLNLEATPISYSVLTIFPFLSVQIFANSSLFREANSTDFFLNTLSVNGTWRR